jgi:uncharacterized protein (UPF0261 family)
MVNFGALETVPPQYRERTLHEHNAAVTLMRTSPAENAAIGELMAGRLNAATGPVSVLFPTGGFSELSREGAPFHDPATDSALRASLTEHLRSGIELELVDCNINDEEFAAALVARVAEYTPARQPASTNANR